LEPEPASGAGGWLVAGVVIETVPHRAPDVEHLLTGVEGLRIVGGDGDRRLAGVLTAPTSDRLAAIVEKLVQTREDILGIFPTFVGTDDGDVSTGEEPTED
jgi:hypothetical protein